MLHCEFCDATRRTGLLGKKSGDASAMFCQQRNWIGAQQLIVADGWRNRPRARPIWYQSGLGIVGAVSARLESIDSDDLLTRESGRDGRLRVGLLELPLVRRPLWYKSELLRRVLEKVRDHRNLGALDAISRRPCGRLRINWPLRSGIHRRLRKQVIIDADRLVIAALGIAQPTLRRDRVPVSSWLGLVGGPGSLILGEPCLIVGERVDRRVLSGSLNPGQRGGNNAQAPADCASSHRSPYRHFWRFVPFHKKTRRQCGAHRRAGEKK